MTKFDNKIDSQLIALWDPHPCQTILAVSLVGLPPQYFKFTTGITLQTYKTICTNVTVVQYFVLKQQTVAPYKVLATFIIQVIPASPFLGIMGTIKENILDRFKFTCFVFNVILRIFLLKELENFQLLEVQIGQFVLKTLYKYLKHT